MKNKVNLVFNLLNSLFCLIIKCFLFLTCFNSTILSYDKANLLIKVSINFEINVE